MKLISNGHSRQHRWLSMGTAIGERRLCRQRRAESAAEGLTRRAADIADQPELTQVYGAAMRYKRDPSRYRTAVLHQCIAAI
jgi:hypothetical protein